jgi:uncharacterized protein (TIGR02246 family)
MAIEDPTQLRRLQDVEEIRALVHAYGQHLDAREIRAYAELFAEQGEWRGGLGTACGPDEVEALMNKVIEPQPAGRETHHVITDVVIEVTGDDAATGVMTWMLFGPDDDGLPRVFKFGHYNDVYVRERGQWKFNVRAAQRLIPAVDWKVSV